MSPRRLLASILLSSSMFLAACAATPHAAPHTAPKVVDAKPATSIDRAQLRAALAERRATTIQRFVEYREARVYPVNSYTPGAQHVWMDTQGHLCAAANLVALDWGRPASERIAAENNFLKLADVHDGPVFDWMLTTGLTRTEIVEIQEVVIGEDGVARRSRPGVAGEIVRLYDVWLGVERALGELTADSLDAATDALMKRPELAARVLTGATADAGKYGDAASAVAFAKPPA
jgi:hypothetical protein